MKVSAKYGFAFLCMPKCASTSIESVLKKYSELSVSGDPRLKHINAKKYKEYIVPIYQDIIPDAKIEVFCMMREPMDWLNSWYRYRARKELANPRHPQHKNYTGNMSYEDFLLAYLESDRPPYARVGSQYNFITLPNGDIGVDKIFNIDSIDKVEKYISQKVGEKIKIPQKNVSGKISKKVNIPNELEKKIKDLLKNDYDLYESIK